MATNLKVERIKKDFSQDYLALRVGISQGRISLIERGKISPTPKEAEKISEALNMPTSALLDNTHE